MGPRSCERGNGLVKEVRQEFHFASMGPRSCERGNRACAAESARIERSFNGAALVRARKYAPALSRFGRHIYGFNGAALVRARKCTVKR